MQNNCCTLNYGDVAVTVLPEKPNNTTPGSLQADKDTVAKAAQHLQTLCNAKETQKVKGLQLQS